MANNACVRSGTNETQFGGADERWRIRHQRRRRRRARFLVSPSSEREEEKEEEGFDHSGEERCKQTGGICEANVWKRRMNPGITDDITSCPEFLTGPAEQLRLLRPWTADPFPEFLCCSVWI